MNSYNVNIKPRIVSCQFSADHQKFWLDNCPVKTFFANTLSLIIPEAEKFFINSVRTFYNDIHHPALKSAAKKFIQQEANHRRAHTAYNQQIIQQFYPNLSLKLFNFPLPSLFAIMFGKKMRLAMSAVGEHFTAVLADFELRTSKIFDRAPNEIVTLWHWHCLEEIEHKSVVFDVLKHVKVGYIRRTIGFFAMSCFIFSAFCRVFYYMAKQEKLHKNWLFFKYTLKFFWKDPGLFSKSIKPYFAYLRPSFHPWQQDNKDLIVQWESRLKEKFN